jgi:hypothetical protein
MKLLTVGAHATSKERQAVRDTKYWSDSSLAHVTSKKRKWVH